MSYINVHAYINIYNVVLSEDLFVESGWGGVGGMARKNDRLFSSLVLYSSFKHAFSYKLCYSIDKKADTNEKKEVKRIAEMKQMRTFVDENKRSFSLVRG